MVSTRTSDSAVRHTLAGCCCQSAFSALVLFSPVPCVHTCQNDARDKIQATAHHLTNNQIAIMLTDAW